MDSQVVELLGRNRLIDELLRSGLEVALPIRDRGIDLIAYADLESKVPSFIAKPIQMKAASQRSFSLDRKYAKFPDLILAYVWNLERAASTVTFALTYREAFEVAMTMGWTTTNSWTSKGYYVNNNPGSRLLTLLKPHRMTPKRWWRKVTGATRTP